uniref:Response regulatory domain-containing protein n=1 Tax=Pyrodinium bahamense TaxID=73915 RepID=A0A7S0B5K3_9DINO
MPGKSILILTDKADVRKSIMKALLVAAAEVDIVFVRTTSDLWKRLRDPKEKHHVLILDLAKSELQVDSLLKCCRGHERYGNLPIIVLSVEQELSEVVRASCSFVVFHPLAASMLREALVWCFDRKTLLGGSRYQSLEQDGGDGGVKSHGAPKDLEIQAVNLSMVPAAPAIVVS